MHLSEYTEFDGIGLAAAIKRGDFSREEVVEASIAAIDAFNPHLNAVVIKNFAPARKVSTAAIDGPLSGVPFLLKDVNVFSHDMPTTFSSRFFSTVPAKPDSEIVQCWRQAGLVIMGKTNTPEFAEDYVCEPTFRGPTLNPWNPALTVGGSSGGAGAAVAAAMVPIAHGTDLGGSIRIPAACCGVFGFKPTSGLSPVDAGAAEIASGFNADHVLTRSVRDSAAVLDITAKPLLGSRYRVVPQVASYLDCLQTPLPALRIGVCVQTPTGETVPERQQQAVQKVSKLLEASGHELFEYQYPSDLDLGSWSETLWMLDVVYEIERQIAAMGREPAYDEQEALTRYLRARVSTMTAMQHHEARLRAHGNSVKLMQSMANMDLLLTPALGSDPIPLGSLDSRTEAFDYETWANRGYAFAPFAQVCNFTGQPAASLPVQLTKNTLPCAVQLAGHTCQDHHVLQVSAQLEEALGWCDYRPPMNI